MKQVYKLLPVSLYDIPGVEGWLEERANDGLFPTHLGSYAAFSRTGVPGARFRLIPWGKMGTDPSEEQLELYARAGWEYLFSVGRTFFLFYTADPAAPEPFTDYESRGMSLDRLARQVKRSKRFRFAIPVFLILPVLLALVWPASRFDVQPDPLARLPLLLLYLFDPALLFFFVIMGMRLPPILRDCRTLLRTHKALKAGLPPPPSPGPQRKIVRENVASIILTFGLALFIIGNYAFDSTVPAAEFQKPFVALQSIETEPVFSHESLYGYNDRFSVAENQAKRHFSLLAPVWYEVDQAGYSPHWGGTSGLSPNPQGGKYQYHPSLDMTYFRLLLPALARPAAKAQMDFYRAINLRWSYEEIGYPGLDFVILATEPDGVYQMAALARDGRVAVFCYAGVERLADQLPQLAEVVS